MLYYAAISLLPAANGQPVIHVQCIYHQRPGARGPIILPGVMSTGVDAVTSVRDGEAFTGTACKAFNCAKWA